MKLCSRCSLEKEFSEFHKNNSSGSGYQSYCKQCNKLWVRERYLSNKKYYTDKNKNATIRNSALLLDYLKNHPCVDCGESDPIVLEFDHDSGDKVADVSRMALSGYSVKTIELEIAKCSVRCANCHRRKTMSQGLHYRYKELNKER